MKITLDTRRSDPLDARWETGKIWALFCSNLREREISGKAIFSPIVCLRGNCTDSLTVWLRIYSLSLAARMCSEHRTKNRRSRKKKCFQPVKELEPIVAISLSLSFSVCLSLSLSEPKKYVVAICWKGDDATFTSFAANMTGTTAALLLWFQMFCSVDISGRSIL